MLVRSLATLLLASTFAACATSSQPTPAAAPEKMSCGQKCSCPSHSCTCEGCKAHKGGDSCTCGAEAAAPAAGKGHSCGHAH